MRPEPDPAAPGGRHRGGAARIGLLDRVVLLATRPAGADLGRLVELLHAELGARRCRLELWSPGGQAEVREWPDGGGREMPARATQVLLRWAGEQIGVLAVDQRAVRRLRRRQRAALRELGAVLGPALYAAATQARIDAAREASARAADRLGEVRAGAVAEQEADRRGLERDLHDGAQHHLVTLQLVTGLLDHALGAGDVVAVQDRLHKLEELLDLTESGLAATAAGVLPADLVAAGLVAELESELGAVPEVRIEADDAVRGRRYPVPVEVTVYFACLEAVNNARKYAPGAGIRVRLRHTARGLAFAVLDDGPGFDPAAGDGGSGLPRLADRVAGAGGELTVRSAPGAGTAVEGFIPV